LEIFLENILRLLEIVILDLKKGPKDENKKENIFLLILSPKHRPIKKNK
jgi:hypothetical protein